MPCRNLVTGGGGGLDVHIHKVNTIYINMITHGKGIILR